MPGSVARNFHSGSRSEILADYLFSGWGTVSPVRRADDTGVDLHCTLTEPSGQRSTVTDYYSVQVKSSDDPWVFDSPDSIQWLLKYPTPLFLACVDKSNGLSVYHTMPRFLAGFYAPPNRLELRPSQLDEGVCTQWENGESFSLSAPIIRVSIADLTDSDKLNGLQQVIKKWVMIDNHNCVLRQMGLLRFKMPYSYRVNKGADTGGRVEQGMTRPNEVQLAFAVQMLTEAADCIGHQINVVGDREGAVYSAILTRYLRTSRPELFSTESMFNPGATSVFELGLSDTISRECLPNQAQSYAYQALDAIVDSVRANDLVSRFLRRDDSGVRTGTPEGSSSEST